ncbi:hypothetical protein ES703_54237 [subsurface metagenome]
MNRVLERVGYKGWTSAWAPGKSSKSGEVIPRERLIIIYDKDPSKAWETFRHELVELRLRRVLRPYRLVCNKLIEAVEKVTYEEKETFIKELPDLLQAIEEGKPDLKELLTDLEA